MALASRKGFIHTLEAILASTLVLGIIVTVIPEFQQQPDTKPQQQIRSGLEALDSTGNLTDNLSISEIESDIKPYVPRAYNHSVNIVEVNSTSGDGSSLPRYIDKTGSYSEVQLWIKSSSGLDIIFNGKTLLEDYSGKGYEAIPVSNSKGWLNSTGTAELEYSFDSYNSSKDDINQEDVSVVNYVAFANGTKEIQVRIWR